MDKKHIEYFYDYFDGIAMMLYEKSKKSYIEGMIEAFNYLMDDAFQGDYIQEVIAEATSLKGHIEDIDFKPEEIRKAVQLGILKGYKHERLTNALMTPDTIGIFISYLIQKLYDKEEINTIIDPVIGTGNLVYTIVNQLKKDIKVFGVDNHLVRCELARNFGDLISIKNQIFYQDTLKYFDQGFDLSVMDLPINENPNLYLPYQIILHHLDSINPGKYMISLIENDFFEQKDNEIFKQEVNKKAHIYGLVKLNESLFKSNPKSILILQKKGANVKKLEKFLLVDLPSFSEETAFATTIKQIDQWFEARKGHVE